MLIVKNFGPLVDIHMKPTSNMVIIGPQSSGKSTLLKTLAILNDTKLITQLITSNDLTTRNNEFVKKFKDYQILFFDDTTYINYQTDFYTLIYENQNVIVENYRSEDLGLMSGDYTYRETLTQKFSRDDNERMKDTWVKARAQLEEKVAKDIRINLDNKKISLKIEEMYQLFKENVVNEMLNQKLKEEPYLATNLEKKFYYNSKPLYIPAERSFLSLFAEHAMSFINQDIPVPKYISEFYSEFEKARNYSSDFHIPFLNINYKYDQSKNQDLVTFLHLNDLPMKLSTVSSGIQTTLPLVVVTEYLHRESFFADIYIEEPEQNLYPNAQQELIKLLMSFVNDRISIMVTTHSPYILTAYNLLLLSFIVGNLCDEARSEVNNIIEEKYWLNHASFDAFYIENGTISSIFDQDTKMITDNAIDEASVDVSGILDNLLHLYRKYQ